MNKLKTESI